MTKNKEFAVIGLGRFGGSVCEELINLGMEVMAIDKDEDRVNLFSKIASHAVIADATDEMALKNLGIRNFDHVVVAIGDDVKSSILVTLILKELGVKNVTAKAQDEYHGKVLTKVGADDVIHPERDMGVRIAKKMVSYSILDYLDLSDEHSIVEIIANEKVSGRTIIQLDIRAKYGINIVAIKRGDDLIASPRAHDVIRMGDVLVIIGSDDDIDRFEYSLR